MPEESKKTENKVEMDKGLQRGLGLKAPQYTFAVCVLLPIVAVYVTIRIIPVFGTLFLSFHRWDLVNPTKPFIGFKNYIKLFHDRLFVIAIKNTCVLAFLSLVITLGISFGLALILNRKEMRGGPIYEGVYFLPFIISWVPLSVMWKWIYDPGYGILNYAISFIGIPPQGWLVNPDLALYSIVILVVWRNLGLYIVLFSVGLKNIPSEYHDAAVLDGAGGISLFRYIILPLLKPIVLYIVVMSTIINFSIFAPVFVMTIGSQAAPGNAVRVLVYDMYENGFRFLKMGYAGAESAVLLVIVLLLTLIEFASIRSKM